MVPIDGSEDDKINITNLVNYTMDNDDEDEDKEATYASDEDEDQFSD